MSELARRAIRALPRLAGAPEPNSRDQAARPLVVDVRAPRDLVARCGVDMSEALAEHLRRLCRELGVGTSIQLTSTMEPVGHPHIAISIGGRPVALVPADAVAHSISPAATLCALAVRGTMRRLPLLLDTGMAASGVADYVVSIGCAPPPKRLDHELVTDSAEWVIDQVMPDEIVLGVPAEMMRRVDGAGRRAVAELREAEFRSRGIRYPDVRVEIVDEGAATMVMRLNHVTLPLIALPEEAGWEHVVGRLRAELVERRHWFVRRSQVEELLSVEMEYLYPELVAAARRAFSVEQVSACLRELLRGGRRIRNVPRILWLMLEQGDAHGRADILRLSEAPLTPRGGHAGSPDANPVVLAARVRKIAIEEAWRLGSFSPPTHARRLDEELEAHLVGSKGDTAKAAEWNIVRALLADPEAERVVTRTIEAIGPVRDAIQALGRPLRVVASQELPPDTDLEQFAVLPEGRAGVH